MKKYTHEIHLRLTNEEYNELMKRKELLNCATYAELIRAYIHTGICYRADYNGLFEVATQISKIGNNINQIAHIANLDQTVTSQQITDLQNHIQELDKIFAKGLEKKVKIKQQFTEKLFIHE